MNNHKKIAFGDNFQTRFSVVRKVFYTFLYHKINPVRSKTPEATAAPLVWTSNGIKAIIFDLGNVLIDFNHRIAAKEISKFTESSPDEIFELFFDSELTGLFEEGKIQPEDFFLKLKAILNLRLNYDEFVPIWNDIFFLSENNRAVYNLAKTLKRYYKLALLSNINILHFEYLKKEFPVFDAFHNIITSFEVGLRKPHPLIYKKTLEALGVLPGEVFYIDDRADLTQSAKELGIRGFVFKGIEQLKKDLLDTGVNIK